MVCRKSLSCIWRLCLLASMMFFMSACCHSQPLSDEQARQLKTNSSAWVVYWDLDSGLKEASKAEKRLQALFYFAADFAADDHFVLPQELVQARKKKRKGGYTEYLSFVNDYRGSAGNILKDTAVLKRVLKDENSRKEHIAEIIALTKSNGFAGVEIDYENIWKDTEVKGLFLKFLPQLQNAANAEGLKLRIVLQPSVDFGNKGFVEGPEYVVMLYNLYGLHSDVGPKADEKFLIEVLQAMQKLPGKKSAALSVGGCMWSTKGKPRFITEREAVALAKQHNETPKRDKDSGALHFRFRKGTAVEEVWYADKETLAKWVFICKKYRVDTISFWRLGGNVDADGMMK